MTKPEWSSNAECRMPNANDWQFIWHSTFGIRHLHRVFAISARMVDFPSASVKPRTLLTGHGCMEAVMNDQQTIFERLGNWFRRNDRDGDLLSDSSSALEHRSTFLRPWARRDAAINNLQEASARSPT